MKSGGECSGSPDVDEMRQNTVEEVTCEEPEPCRPHSFREGEGELLLPYFHMRARLGLARDIHPIAAAPECFGNRELHLVNTTESRLPSATDRRLFSFNTPFYGHDRPMNRQYVLSRLRALFVRT